MLAELVRQEGQEAPRALYGAFESFNAQHFEGKLQQPMLLITQPSSPRRLADYVPKDEHGLVSRIRIAPRCVRFGLPYLLDVLLHEMVHAWQHEVLNDLEPGYEGHGPEYAGKCNSIGASMQLGPVSPKGRRGLPKAEHWPVCVRPPGYYGAQTPPWSDAKVSGVSRHPRRPSTPVEFTDADVSFFRVLASALGERDVATTLRRLAVEEARRLARGEGGTVVQKALDDYLGPRSR